MIVRIQAQPRRGVVSVWALIVLVLLAAISTSVISQTANARRTVDTAQAKIQADWLARGGVERAVARLLRDPKAFTETTDATLTVTADGDVFRIVSEVKVPVLRGTVTATARRNFKRTTGSDGVRLEPLP